MSMLKALCRLPLLIALGTLFLGGIIHSQEYQSFQTERDSITDESQSRLGPLFLDPSLLMNISYDSNIYGMVATEDEVGDYYINLAVPTKASWLYRKWFIAFFSGTPTYRHFFKIKEERAFGGQYSIGARMFLLDRFSLSGSFVYSKERERLTREMQRPVSRTSLGYNYGFFLETARHTAIGISGSTVSHSYEDATLPGVDVPLSISLDRTEWNVQGEFYYQFVSEVFFFTNLGYTAYRFANPYSAYRDSHSFQAYSGIRFPAIGRRARGTISLGYKKFIPEQQGYEGFSGIVGDTSFSIRLGRFNFSIMFIRDVPFSFGTSIFYINHSYGGGLSYYLNQYIRLSYEYSKGKGDYPTPQEIIPPDGPPVLIRRADIYESHSGQIVFRIYRNFGLGVFAEFSKRHSNFYEANLERAFYGIYLTHDF